MRTAPGKKLGYVILPVIIPAGQTEAEFLADSKTWQTTWQVVQALRSHDAGIDNSIARAERGDFSGKIEIVDMRNLQTQTQLENTGTKNNPRGRATIGGKDAPAGQETLPFHVDELMRGIYAKLAEKCGTRLYWPQWAARLGKTAEALKQRIDDILDSEDSAYAGGQKAFAELEQALKDNVSTAINRQGVLNILAAQAIAMPVFAALFGVAEYDFAVNNAVARSLQTALDAILRFIKEERERLETLYSDIRAQLGESQDDAFRQSLIKDIYQNTIKAVYGEAAAKTVVYTPIKAVDFILRSVDNVLKSEFDSSFDDDNICVLEPFAGTGSFVARLLGGRRLPPAGEKEGKRFVSPAALPGFYQNRLWLNEINLLAYYAAVANVETTYHKETGNWQNFAHACLTDTFILNRTAPDFHDCMAPLAKNRENLQRQEQAKINVIIGNPPYGETDGNSDNLLNERVRNTYGKGNGEQYIRAFRWATDRIKDKGIVAFITGGGFLTSSTATGLRKHLAKDFSSLYIFNLRGNANTQGELRKKEGGGVFAEGSRTPAAISILVKNPAVAEKGRIFYHDIGDYCNRDKKLGILQHNSITTLPFTPLTADKYGDWLNKRDDSFSQFMPLMAKTEQSLFVNSSNGVKTNRDAWAYNVSHETLRSNMQSMIVFYQQCAAERRVIKDDKQISWDSTLEADCLKGKAAKFAESHIVPSLYRPFTRSYLYYSRQFNNSVYQMLQIFPNLGDKTAENIVICVNKNWKNNGNIALIVNAVPDWHCDGDTECFPLYRYEQQGDGSYKRQGAISDAALAYFCAAYPDAAAEITREDIFYYIYGLLHSPQYREKYKNNLMKELPRIPRVKSFANFQAFNAAGRALAELHLNFDDFGGKSIKELAAQAGVEMELPHRTLHSADYRVEKMRFGGRPGAKDKTEIRYNQHITIKNIPLAAYAYAINGRSGIGWVVDRQQIKQDKLSGIVHDPNAYAKELGDPAYPLKLLLNVIYLSLATQKIITNLPDLLLE
ncbi:type ISP restriction/modification enzyme [Candidatus Tokpelaia sp.]|uniref:type ISP restriction/modification enzyme n=1 Tax=Candidatus Tokpelaia sp. TaxID=2233777 RepID=UPI00123B2969|nr:type ISP restriction/modification enzyme [Candidatus Tokpelaia sp.]KAA6406085.1 hypothetical protein DPQ22_01210 [Candidatus Tokpelaia sp.]